MWKSRSKKKMHASSPSCASGVSAAKKRFALSEGADLEATTEESIECVSSSGLEKSKKDEALCNNEKVKSRSPLKSFECRSQPVSFIYPYGFTTVTQQLKYMPHICILNEWKNRSF